ncbi:Caspase-8 [Paramuricea clavata]|uniref:Caspase-8, partial n=1 Tax=Paramuricea clavata TaxID=317549 RepID=A0A6S7IMR9_PARCT|nr:Caspase-8 [Paramuricea clavata]
MENRNSTIPDIKYRGFMVKLSHRLTSQDTEELKYMLTSVIPAGVMESLDTTLKLFLHLEKQLFVGPNELWELQELFRAMESQRLCDIVTNFIADSENRMNEIPETLQ